MLLVVEGLHKGVRNIFKLNYAAFVLGGDLSATPAMQGSSAFAIGFAAQLVEAILNMYTENGRESHREMLGGLVACLAGQGLL
jgi:hypothetical protein